MEEAEIIRRMMLASLKTSSSRTPHEMWPSLKDTILLKQELINFQKLSSERIVQFDDNTMMEAFNRWLNENPKFRGHCVEFRESGEKGNGVFVKSSENIEKDDLVLDVPLEMCLFPRIELKSKATTGVPLPEVALKSDVIKMNQSAQLALALLIESAKGDKSFFAPYIGIFPRTFDHLPITWTFEEVVQLSRLHDASILPLRIADVNLLYCHLFQLGLRKIIGTFDDFLWAICVAFTRQNPIPSFSVLGLIPGYDMCNHDPTGQISTEFLPETNSFQCRAFKSFESGQEFSIFYGPRPDLELLVYSGFVCSPGTNKHTSTLLLASYENSTPELQKVKQVLVKDVKGISAPLDEGNLYLLQVDSNSENIAFKCFIRAAVATTKEAISVALKKKLTNPASPLTVEEKEFAIAMLTGKLKSMNDDWNLIAKNVSVAGVCRPFTTSQCQKLYNSNKAVVENLINEC